MTNPLPRKLPDTVEGLGGAISVITTDEVRLSDNAIGMAQQQARKLFIEKGLHPVTAVSTFYHELFHFALYDSGLHHDFDDTQTERLCDLVGSMMSRLEKRL